MMALGLEAPQSTSLAAVMYKSLRGALRSAEEFSRRRISSATESSNSSGVACACSTYI